MPDWRGLLLHVLLPRTCLGCRLDLHPPLQGPLCGDCLARLRPVSGPFCGLCGTPGRRGARCLDCRNGRFRALSLVRAAFPYRDPIPGLLHAFKYRRLRPAGRALADWMAGTWNRYPEFGEPDAVVPVPLHPVRLRERGFNQAQELAEAVGRRARRPVLGLLERVRSTRAQWRLGRSARASNLSGAFRARAGVRGLRLILVDDICTTGGTLEACASALKAAGAERVAAYVLARD